MSARRLLPVIPMAALLAACTSQSVFPTVPFRAAADTTAPVTDEALAVSAEEAEAARSPQPPLHALQTAQFYDALVQRHPDAAAPLRALQRRSLALSRLQLRAAHALAFQDMKTMTLVDMASLLHRWMEQPTQLIGYMQSVLNRVEGLDAKQTVRIARMLPAISVAMEAVGSGVPTQPARAAGINVRHQLIGDVIAMLKTRQPDRAVELTDLEQRLKALSPAGIRALHAAIWEEDKFKTLEQIMDRTTALFQEPGAYAEYIQDHLSQVQGLTAHGLDQLVGSYPTALGRLEDILYGPMIGNRAARP